MEEVSSTCSAMLSSSLGGIIRLNVTSTLMRKRGNKKESSRIKVSISDAGPGQSAEDQSKLFGGFFHVRPDHIHIQQGKGSGLGNNWSGLRGGAGKHPLLLYSVSHTYRGVAGW